MEFHIYSRSISLCIGKAVKYHFKSRICIEKKLPYQFHKEIKHGPCVTVYYWAWKHKYSLGVSYTKEVDQLN